MRPRLLISCVCVATALACGGSDNGSASATSPSPVTATGAFSLTGQVTDGATGAGISGATVSIPSGRNGGKSATTGASGSYMLTGLQPPPSGQQELATVNVSAGNYAQQTKTITFMPSQSDATLSFQLARANTGITFGGLSGLPCAGLFPASPSCAVSSYAESGFTLSAMSGNWIVRTDYGNPGPFIQFIAEQGTTGTAEVQITAGGSTFSFTSVDLYSSTTTIPYRITGSRNSASVFVLSDTVPNTFGDFKTVINPNGSAVIDSLSIVLTNPAQVCCRNPTGLDTIALTR